MLVVVEVGIVIAAVAAVHYYESRTLLILASDAAGKPVRQTTNWYTTGSSIVGRSMGRSASLMIRTSITSNHHMHMVSGFVIILKEPKR